MRELWTGPSENVILGDGLASGRLASTRLALYRELGKRSDPLNDCNWANWRRSRSEHVFHEAAVGRLFTIDGRIYCLREFRVQAVEEWSSWNTQAQLRGLRLERTAVVGNRRVHGCGVQLVITGNHAEHQRGVLDGSAQRTDVIQRPAKRNHSAIA